MNPTLIIFIDAFPFNKLEATLLNKAFSTCSRLIPSFGYSINCQAELFSGLSADALGFWGEFALNPEQSKFRTFAPVLKVLSPISRYRPVSRVFHKMIDRLFDEKTKDIPPWALGLFSRTGIDVFDNAFPVESIIRRYNFKKFSYIQYPGLGLRTDDVLYKSLSDELRSRSAPQCIVSFGKLDYLGHFSGPDSEPFYEYLGLLETRVGELMDQFIGIYKNGKVFVMSDHGMGKIDGVARLCLEAQFGRPSVSSYVYFLEGSILRIWITSNNLRREIKAYLREAKCIVLSDEQRLQFGITSPAFGQIIATLPDNLMWVPSFWGALIGKGNHGYLPDFPQQHGIVLGLNTEALPGVIHARDASAVMRKEIES